MTSQSDVPRMAVIGNCPTCGLAIRWGIGCIGPELVATSPDFAAAQMAMLDDSSPRDRPMPRRQRSLHRAPRPDTDLYPELGVEHCGDCGAGLGQYHHWGCDLEKCPNCHKQLYFGCVCENSGAP